jgi:protein involved in polysaccharide export with SLBB domain
MRRSTQSSSFGLVSQRERRNADLFLADLTGAGPSRSRAPREDSGESIEAEQIAEAPEDDGVRWDVLERRLRYGCIVNLDVRMNNARTAVSHAYPIDVNGKIKMPMLNLVDALDLSLQQLAQNIQRRLTPDYFLSPTVNATLQRRVIAYGANITQERLHLRVLDGSGNITRDSGWYPVRSDGTLNLPYVGVVNARGRRLDVVEGELQTGYRRDYILNAIVHLTPIALDAP